MAVPFSIPSQPLVIVAIGALIAWRIFRRVRRAVGRQKFSAARSWMALILYPLAALGIGLSALRNPMNAAWELAGIAIGVGLAMYSIQRSTFEQVDGDWYYTPHAPIGIALSVLLVARVAYRMLTIYTSTDGFTHQPIHDDFIRSPLTLAIVGTLLGYYFSYSVGLIAKHRTVARSPVAAPPLPTAPAPRDPFDRDGPDR